MTSTTHLPETVVTAPRRRRGPRAEAITLPGCPTMVMDYPSPLPGVIIFVHGVNSTGEWFDTAEEGLCRGLNARLQRKDEHVFRVKGSGQLKPARYMGELTEDGYIHDDLSAATFVADGGYSPVIRFRWGYKASPKEANREGGNILLDEKNAWGGGPFVNGCSALPDLFAKGTDAELIFGALSLTHLQTSDRQVYSAPARHYQAFAAWRLAKLVSRIRELHRQINHCGTTNQDCPITIVCHSQGNMVGITSAYFGAYHPEFKGLGVADNYVLACAPYSLRDNKIDGSTQYDKALNQGRVTVAARQAGLRGFFDIVRHFGEDRAQHYAPDFVTEWAFNRNPQNGEAACTAEQDCKGRDTRARAFLYCSPHDRVISVSTVQGMGWLGLDKADFNAVGAQGMLYQRVWAEVKPGIAYKVGAAPGTAYHYWNHTIGANPETNIFWDPDSERVSVQFRKIWGDDRKSWGGKTLGSIFGFFAGTGSLIASVFSNISKVNGVPPKDWVVHINAPEVPSTGITPRARRLPHGTGELKAGETRSPDGHILGPFNVHYESARDALNRKREFPKDSDPYAAQRPTGHGNAQSEAAMRYDQNAGLRQRARRHAYDEEGKLNKDAPFNDQDIQKMDAARHHELRGTALGNYIESQRIKQFEEGDRQQPSNHSTILTNPEHAEHVLAYDVDVGVCLFDAQDMAQFRRMADWRWCKPQPRNGDEYPAGRDPAKDNEYEYYHSEQATLEGKPLEEDPRFVESKGAVAAIQIPGERYVRPPMPEPPLHSGG
ncbi:MAG: ribonuclease G [Ralstonia sp.]|uniref:T6SS effector phospholipase Tle3 domain-containing protein n=1 Tax=Ralstonia pickettii TaxID=329 RepID=UPI000CD5B486|nr:ribonuclease G [Ralstonia sp.]POH90025.1 ribonuclease G [Ralstonia pickettii]MBA4230172.1 ribonuclease G [Ralstonia sp.]MBA4234973.1 ribonuclease G [Ralstonia sp.]MBA4277950.1 ribonuclease G [Ralstonia sp.]